MALALIPQKASAQKVAISTNLGDWAYLATANVDVSYAFARRFSVTAAVKYNNWEFNKTNPDIAIFNKNQTANVSIRFWPWFVYSGWWISLKAQYSKFSRAGIWRPAMENATAVGGGLGFGYTFMISKHFNIELGAGAWGGRMLDYQLYCCPKCMELREEGPRNFIDFDEARVALQFVF